MDRGDWQGIVRGIARVRHDLETKQQQQVYGCQTFLEGPDNKYFRFCKLYCPTKAAIGKIYMNESGCILIKLYLWGWKCEFHVIFMCYKIFIICFKLFKNVKPYLALRT